MQGQAYVAETAIGRNLGPEDRVKVVCMLQNEAEEALANKDSSIDYAKAQAELATAVAQLAAIQKLRQKR